MASTASDENVRALGRVIAARAQDIEARWLTHVQAAVAKTPDVALTSLRDGIPDYLEALAQWLTEGGDLQQGSGIWSRVARHHGITRVRIGFDIGQLVREFVVLRQQIRAVALESGASAPVFDALLADVIEAAIIESVGSYVEARDYETRRVQAQNLGFLTHELRNPLSTAVGSVELLRYHATAEQQRALDTLERSHDRLLELIDSVLDVERLEAGDVEVRLVEVREADLLELATEAARKAAQRKGLAFEIRCDPERRIKVDPSLTLSALQNLADNAVKYTDAGAVEVVTGADETSWVVHVRDTGPGLSPEELRTIFEPFRRGATTKKGTGLGLTIARRAIEAQGGTLEAESPGPVGCHFWIALPRQRA